MRISDWSSDVCSSDLFLAPSTHIEGEDRAASAHLPHGQFMLRMTGETGMQYFFYTAFKEFPHGKRILALPLRTQGERFHPLQHDPGLKGAECRASVAMKWQQHIFDEIFRTAHGSGKQIGRAHV